MKRRGSPRLWLALFFATLTLVGLATCADYGRPCDELIEMNILRMNVNQYREALGREPCSTLPGFGEQKFDYIRQDTDRDHGVSAYYPVWWLATSERVSGAQRMTLWHAYTWLWFMLGVFALYSACRDMGLSRPFACLGCLILYLSPRFFAEGHYNNKDVVFLSLTLCVLATGMRLMKRPTLRRALPFALAGALAANTKIAGVALWGLCALVVLARQLAARAFTRRVAGVALATIALFAALCALLTPALWDDPIALIRYSIDNATLYSRWDGVVAFAGALYRPALEALPWYYLPVMIALTLPLWTLLSVALGIVAMVARLIRQRARFLADDGSLSLLMAGLCFLVPFLFAVFTRPLIYNGWRHFYFLFAGMALLAAYGLWAVRDAVRGRVALRRGLAAALGLCLLATGVQNALNHPRQYVYYNALASIGGVEGRYETDYWNVSVRETLLQWLKQTEGDDLTIGGVDRMARDGLAITFPTIPNRFNARMTICSTEEGDDPRYLLVNESYAFMSGWAPTPDLRLVTRVSAYGHPLCSIYEREATR